MTKKTSPAPKTGVLTIPQTARGTKTGTRIKEACDSNSASGTSAQTSPAPKTSLPAMHGTARGTKTGTRTKRLCDSKNARGTSAHTVPASTESSTAIGESAQGPLLHNKLLGLLADVVDDLEAVRKANENRLRTLTDTSEYGFGLTLDNPDVLRLANAVAGLNTKSKVLEKLGFDSSHIRRGLEQQAILDMNQVMHQHPLWPWAKGVKGLGEKQFARLLAMIRDPYWNDKHERPRTLRELRAYCGYNVWNSTGNAPVYRRRKEGEPEDYLESKWNSKARMRTWLIATQFVIVGDKYRKVYDEARLKYTGSLHPSQCVRCGPKGKPAQPGSPRSDGHCHAMALRKVAVEFLNDLWAEARSLHNETSPAPIAPATAIDPAARGIKTGTRVKTSGASKSATGASAPTSRNEKRSEQ